MSKSLLVFIFLTVILGGGAAAMMGRGFALQWRPLAQLIAAAAGLALGVRFLHYALFGEPLLSLVHYLADFAVMAIAASVAYRLTMVNQMTKRYYWLFERNGPFGWRAKS